MYPFYIKQVRKLPTSSFPNDPVLGFIRFSGSSSETVMDMGKYYFL